MDNKQLKGQLVKLLLEGKQVTVRWDCGGDESFAYPAVDGKELGFDDEFGEALAEYIIKKLNLPDAGEFYLKGGGRFFIEDNNKIVIEHMSVMAGVMDYDEEKEEEIYSEEEEESGKHTLFNL
jgi:hypothetical protein